MGGRADVCVCVWAGSFKEKETLTKKLFFPDLVDIFALGRIWFLTVPFSNRSPLWKASMTAPVAASRPAHPLRRA